MIMRASEHSVVVISTVPDGSSLNLTPSGFYSLSGGVISDKYFATYLDGLLTVSDKSRVSYF